MPRSTREWAHRKIQQAEDNIDWAGFHITEVATTYEKDHKEVSDPLFAAAGGLLEVKEYLAKLRGTF